MAIVIPIIATWNGRGLQRALGDINKAETNFERMAAVGGGMQSVGRQMTLGFTLPIAAIAVQSTKTAATFESTMSQISTVSGKTGTDLENSMSRAREEITRMGTETIYSSQDAANAFLGLQKAGMTTEDVIGGGLSAAMNLAATEGMDLAYASEIMAQAMHAYEIPASEAAKITDILAAGAVASTASVEDLSYGLKYVSSSAAALGVPLDDTVTALAHLNNAGLTASTAGTSLNQMMVALQAPTAAAQKTMDDLGFSILDASGNMKDMPTLLSDLDASMAGMTEPQKQAALKTMFNTRGMRAANILLKEGADGWAEMDEQVNKAGKAAELADSRMSGMAGVLERLRGSAETAGVAFGNAIAPIVEAFATGLEKVLNWFTKLSPGMQTFIAGALLVLAALGPIIMMVGAFVAALGVLIPVITTGALVIGIIAGAFFWWIIAIAAVVAAIIALVVVVVKNWDKIKQWIVNAIRVITETITGWINDFKQQFPQVFSFITNVVSVAWDLIVGIFKVALGWITGFVKMTWNTVVNIFKFAFKAIWGIVSTTLKLVWNFISTVMKTVLTIFDGVIGAIKAIFKGDFDAMWQIVKDTIGKVLGILGGFPGRVLSAIGDLGSTLYNAGKELIQGLIDGIKSMFSSVKNAVASVIPGGNMAVSATIGPRSRGIAYYGVGKTRGAKTTGPITININGAQDTLAVARQVKRAIEGYDLSQGRERNQPLAVAW